MAYGTVSYQQSINHLDAWVPGKVIGFGFGFGFAMGERAMIEDRFAAIILQSSMDWTATYEMQLRTGLSSLVVTDVDSKRLLNV